MAYRVIPQDSPEAHCLNDLDHKVWKIIARRAVGHGRLGSPYWAFLDELGKREEAGGEDKLVHRQINEGWLITIQGTYNGTQLLFGKRPKLGA